MVSPKELHSRCPGMLRALNQQAHYKAEITARLSRELEGLELGMSKPGCDGQGRPGNKHHRISWPVMGPYSPSNGIQRSKLLSFNEHSKTNKQK